MIKILFTSTLIFIIAFFSFSVSKVEAAQFSSSDYSLKITITKDSTTFEASMLLQNSDVLSLINGYDFIAPFTGLNSVFVTLEGSPVNFSIVDMLPGEVSKVSIDFSNNSILNNQAKQLVIKGQITNFVKSLGEFKYAYLSQVNDKISSLTINYPNDYGSVSFNTFGSLEQTSLDTTSEMVIKNYNAGLITWGDEYTIGIETNVAFLNESSSDIQSLLNIIPNRLGQEVYYTNVKNSLFGLYDGQGNYYANVNIPAGTSKESGFITNVRKYSAITVPGGIVYNFGFPADNSLVSDIDGQIRNGTSSFESLKILNEFLLQKFELDTAPQDRFENEAKYWFDLTQKDQFSSLDYSFIIAATAEHLNLKAQINYGYVVLPKQSGESISPHFWVVIDDGSKTFIIDTFMEKLTGLSYFGLTTELDRVTMGAWNPTLKYNNTLGLLSESNFSQGIVINTNPKITTTSSDISIKSLEIPDSYAGFYHGAKLEVENSSSKFIPVDAITYYGYNFSNSLKLFPDLKLGLLPKQTNIFSLYWLRNPNFFDLGRKEVTLTFQLNNPNGIESIFANAGVEYRINYYALIIAVIAGFITFAGVVIFVKKALRRRNALWV